MLGGYSWQLGFVLKTVVASSDISVGSRADVGSKAASVGEQQSSPKIRNDGFSPVVSCGVLQ